MAKARRRTVPVKHKIKETVTGKLRQRHGAEGKRPPAASPATAVSKTASSAPPSANVEAPDAAAEEPGAEEEESSKVVSRGQRRRRAKREGFLRKFEFVNATQKEDKAREGGALGSLEGLGKAAERALEEESRPGRKKIAFGKQPRPLPRKKQALAIEREIAQYQKVLKVDAFQKDPLGALEQHLRNSLKKQKDDLKARESGAGARGRRRRKFRAGMGKGKRRTGAGAQEAGVRKGVLKSSLKQKKKTKGAAAAAAAPAKKMEES